jgi:MFS family permease
MRFFIFLALQALISIALHGTRPIVSLYADSLGASAITIGLLVSSFALLPMLAAVSVGKWLDQYGSRKITLIGGGGILLAFIAPVIYPTIGMLFFSQFLIGLSHICTLLGLQKIVGNLPGNRDKLIATFSMMGSLGELIGPLVSGYSYEYFGFQSAFSIFSILVVTTLGIGVFMKHDFWLTGNSSSERKSSSSSSSSSSKSHKKEPTWKLLGQIDLRKALIISGLVLYSKDLFVAYFPIYGSGLGMTPSTIGIILSIMAGMSISVRMIQFWLVQKFGRARILTTTLVISGFAFSMIPFASTPVIIAIMAGALGAGLGLGQPLSLVYALNVSTVERQGEVLGLRLTFNRGSQFAAPFLFGGIGGVAGLSPVFWISGCILILGAYFTRMTSSPIENEGIEVEKDARAQV